jgi:hypothetical protein
MTISGEQLAAVGSLGYTPVEARFLSIVATHSGYFVMRQFTAFAQANPGKRSDPFAKKLKSRGHAGWREYPRLGGVYRLSSKTLYRVLDKENLCSSRRHATEFIRTRLLALDFVLPNQSHRYLETESEKIAYFSEQRGVPRDALPAKTHAQSGGTSPAVRYFTDNFPLFLDRAADSLPTFTYVNPAHATFAGLAHHLNQYQKLLVHLTDFRFLYISDSPAHFFPAERCFRFFAKRVLERGVADDLSRYFRLRRAWDRKEYGSLTNDDVEWLERADARFKGPETERRYAAWCAGPGTHGGMAKPAEDAQPPCRSYFHTYLVVPGTRAAKDEPIFNSQEEAHGHDQETT